jgi:hypothetical protein
MTIVLGNTKSACGNKSRYGFILWHPGQKYLRASTFSAWSAAKISSRVDAQALATSTTT